MVSDCVASSGVVENPFFCIFGQVTSPLCASVSLFPKYQEIGLYDLFPFAPKLRHPPPPATYYSVKDFIASGDLSSQFVK